MTGHTTQWGQKPEETREKPQTAYLGTRDEQNSVTLCRVCLAAQPLTSQGFAETNLSNVCEHRVRDVLAQRGHELQDQQLPPLPGMVPLQLQETPSRLCGQVRSLLILRSHVSQRLPERTHRAWRTNASVEANQRQEHCGHHASGPGHSTSTSASTLLQRVPGYMCFLALSPPTCASVTRSKPRKPASPWMSHRVPRNSNLWGSACSLALGSGCSQRHPDPSPPHLLHRAPHATRTFPSAHHKDVTASGCPICVTAAALHPGCCRLCVRMGWGSTCHQGHRKLSPGRARRSQGSSHGDYSEPQTHH